MNQHYGKLFEVQLAGESHGAGVGAIIQGCPAGLALSETDIQAELDKRKPGQKLTTPRKEADAVKIKSGVFNGKTTGAPILLWMDNQNADSSTYESMRHTPRPGHADVTAAEKYGDFNDYRGSGPFSARLTAGLVAAGTVAKKILSLQRIEFLGHVQQLGGTRVEHASDADIRKNVPKSALRCADAKIEETFEKILQAALGEGDSVGAVIEVRVNGLPSGIGEPRAQSVEALIGGYCLGLPAAKGVEFGEGFAAAAMKGSDHNDVFALESGKITPATNHAGGTLGGITTGAPLVFRVAFKPTSSIAKTQATLDTKTGKQAALSVKGRHDPCVALRAVPIVESVAAIVLLDLMLQAQKIPRVLE